MFLLDCKEFSEMAASKMATEPLDGKSEAIFKTVKREIRAAFSGLSDNVVSDAVKEFVKKMQLPADSLVNFIVSPLEPIRKPDTADSHNERSRQSIVYNRLCNIEKEMIVIIYEYILSILHIVKTVREIWDDIIMLAIEAMKKYSCEDFTQLMLCISSFRDLVRFMFINSCQTIKMQVQYGVSNLLMDRVDGGVINEDERSNIMMHTIKTKFDTEIFLGDFKSKHDLIVYYVYEKIIVPLKSSPTIFDFLKKISISTIVVNMLNAFYNIAKANKAPIKGNLQESDSIFAKLKDVTPNDIANLEAFKLFAETARTNPHEYCPYEPLEYLLGNYGRYFGGMTPENLMFATKYDAPIYYDGNICCICFEPASMFSTCCRSLSCCSNEECIAKFNLSEGCPMCRKTQCANLSMDDDTSTECERKFGLVKGFNLCVKCILPIKTARRLKCSECDSNIGCTGCTTGNLICTKCNKMVSCAFLENAK